MNVILSNRQEDVVPDEIIIQNSGKSVLPDAPEVVLFKTVNDISLVAGLDWHATSGPEIPVIKINIPLVLNLPSWRAQIDKSVAVPGSGSLLVSLAGGLLHENPQSAGTWVFAAQVKEQDSAPSFMLAIADLAPANPEDEIVRIGRINPRAGHEYIFRDQDSLITALKTHIQTMEISGIVVCRPNDTDDIDMVDPNIFQKITSAMPDMTCHEVMPRTEDLPVFGVRRHISLKPFVSVVTGLVVIFIVFFWVVPVIRSMTEEPPPPPVAMTDVVVEKGVFARECLAGFNTWWPRSVSWETIGRGCAIKGHFPDRPVLPLPEQPGRLFENMVIWKEFVLVSNRNIVLARTAAELMLETWPYESRLDGNRLVLWYNQLIPMVAVDVADETGLTQEEIGRQLLIAWAEAPESVIVANNEFSIKQSSDLTGIEIFNRSSRVPEIEPVSFIEISTGQKTLKLVPPVSRQVPSFLFETDSDESS